MDHQWMGPFKITKCLGKGLYSLKSCSSDKAPDRVHEFHLKLYIAKFLFSIIYSGVKYTFSF